MTFQKQYPVLRSSANPDELSLTIKSAGVWLIPMIIGIATISGLDIQENDLVAFVENVSIIVASSMTIYGLGRKFYYSIKSKF